jgi:hypothetical protein
VALHLLRLRTARHQQGRTQPRAQAPAYELPAMIGYINGGGVAGLPQDRGPPRLRQPSPGHHRRQHLAADRVREVTRPLDLFPPEETLQI